MRDAERQRAEEASKPKAGGLRRNSTAVAGSHAVAAAPAPPSASGPSTLQGRASEGGGAGGGGAAARGGEEYGESLVAAAGAGVERALRILDRMVVQNSYTDVALDFRYWDDATDAFRCGGACACTAGRLGSWPRCLQADVARRQSWNDGTCGGLGACRSLCPRLCAPPPAPGPARAACCHCGSSSVPRERSTSHPSRGRPRTATCLRCARRACTHLPRDA